MFNPDAFGPAPQPSPPRKATNAAPSKSSPKLFNSNIFKNYPKADQPSGNSPRQDVISGGSGSSAWKPANPEMQQLNRLASKVNDPFVMSKYLDSVMYSKTQNMLQRYKDNLFENNTAAGGRPIFTLPGKNKLGQISAKVNDPYVMSRFLGNLTYNKIAGDAAYENDRLYENKGTSGQSDQTGTFDPNSTRFGIFGNGGSQKPKLFNPDVFKKYKVGQSPDDIKYGQTAVDYSRKHVSGDNTPFVNKDGLPMKQFPDGSYHVMHRDPKTGEDVYVPAGAYYADQEKQKADAAAAKDNKDNKAPFHTGIGWLDSANDKTHQFWHGVFHSSGKAVSKTIDTISRPLYGVNNVRDYLYSLDKQHGSGTIANAVANTPLPFVGTTEGSMSGGRSLVGSWDEIAHDPVGTAKGSFKALWRGISGKDKTLGQDVIAHQAATDNRKTINDYKMYQVGGGLANDLTVDPLNLVGGEFIKGAKVGMRGLGKAKDAIIGGEHADNLAATTAKVARTKVPKDIFKDNEEWTKYIDDLPSKGKYMSADDLFHLVGGNTRKFTTGSQAKQAADLSSHVLNKLDEHAATTTSRNVAKHRAMAAEVRSQMDAVATSAQTDSLIDDVLTHAASNGSKAPQAFTNVLDDLSHKQITKATESEFWRRQREQSVKSGVFKPSTKYPTPEDYINEQKSFEQVLGDSWENNPHLHPAEKENIYGKVDTALKKHPELGPHYKELSDQVTSINKERKLFQERLDTARRRGAPESEIFQHESDVKAAKTKLDVVSQDLHKMRASGVISHANEAVRARLEGRSYIPLDRERADHLSEVRKELDSRLSHTDHSSNVTTFADNTGTTSAARSGLADENHSFIDLNQHDISTPEGRDALFSPDIHNFKDYGHQLNSIRLAVGKAEKANTSALGGIKLTDVKVPDVYRTHDGSIDHEAIDRLLGYNKANREVYAQNNKGEDVIGRPFTENEKAFNRKLAEHVNKTGTQEYGRLLANSLRPAKEAAQAEREAARSSTRFTKALEKPAKDADLVTKVQHVAAKWLDDRRMMRQVDGRNQWVLRHDGKTITVPDPRDYAKLSKIFKDNGIEIPQQIKNLSKTYIDEVNLMRNGQESSAIAPDMMKRLQDLGFAPPIKDPKMFPQWIMKQSKAELEHALSPERLRFVQLFKKTHNVDMRHAYNAYNRFLDTGESHVKWPGKGFEKSTWARLHPNGLTEQDFMAKASGDAHDLRELFMGSPIAPTISKDFAGAKGEFAILKNTLKGYATASKTQEYSREAANEWINTLIKLKNDHPAEYQDMMINQWRKQVKSAADRRLYTTTEVPETVRTHGPGSKRTTGVSKIRTRKSDADPFWDSENWGARVEDWKNAKAADEELTSRIHHDTSHINREELMHTAMENARRRASTDLHEANVKEIKPAQLPLHVTGKDDFVEADKMVRQNLRAETKAKKESLEQDLKNAVRPEDALAAKTQLKDLEKEYKAHMAALDKARKRAVQVRQATIQTLREQSLHKLIAEPIIPERGGIGISIAGKTHLFQVPSRDVLGQGMLRNASDHIVNVADLAYSKTFKPPVANLNSEMQADFYRGMNHPDQVIRIHTDALNDNLGKIPPKEREALFRNAINGTSGLNPESQRAADFIREQFAALAPLFDNKVPVNGSMLTYSEIARYLPKGLQLNTKKLAHGVPTGKDLALMFTNDGLRNPELGAKIAKDPLDLLWNLRIATEKALGRKYIEENLNQMFGVKRMQYLNRHNKSVTSVTDETSKYKSDLIEKYKDLGWGTVQRLDNSHYFHPDIIPDINKMLDLMEPGGLDAFGKMADNIVAKWKNDPFLGMRQHLEPDTGKVVDNAHRHPLQYAGDKADSAMRGFDKTTRGWKAAATVPNPGFYTRNLVGEIMAGWFGGVTNPAHYSRAGKALRYMNGDGRDIAAMIHQQPWAEYVTTRTPNPTDIIATTRHGDKLGVQDISVLYYDHALKTGFLNTERAESLSRFGQSTSRIASSPVGQAWKGARNFGEKVEDWPRIAHFLHAMENAPAHLRKIEDIADYAAKEVRRYHFDYADVTTFEKAVMQRVFPFYKWTRKAIPLMSSMLFVKPGKVMAVPKAMTAISDMSSDDFITNGHPNGFMPSYQDMTPNYIQDLWAYKSTRDAEGKDTYLNMQTPQTDILKVLADPARGATGLLNPLIKVPLELHTGQTVDMGSGQGYPVGTPTQELMHQTPETSFLDKIIARHQMQQAKGATGPDGKWDPNAPRVDENGDPVMKPRRADDPITENNKLTKNPATWIGRLDESTISFLTGIGAYEDSNHVTEPHDPTAPIVTD